MKEDTPSSSRLHLLTRRPGAPSSLARYQAMQFRPTALERAFELAKSGDYETVSDIRKKLNIVDKKVNLKAHLRSIL